jgi:hypothetical protein
MDGKSVAALAGAVVLVAGATACGGHRNSSQTSQTNTGAAPHLAARLADAPECLRNANSDIVDATVEPDPDYPDANVLAVQTDLSRDELVRDDYSATSGIDYDAQVTCGIVGIGIMVLAIDGSEVK